MQKSGVEALVLNWNKLAMENLRQEKYSDAFRLLQKAEDLLRFPDGTDLSRLLAITYNNIGCFYKKTEKYQLALRYLARALDVDIGSVFDKTNVAGTHLNICAVYSLMNNHLKAVGHGIMATKLLKEAADYDSSVSTLVSLIVSIHNTGLEYEFLRENDNALDTYKAGLELSVKHLGNEHPITMAISRSFNALLSKQCGTIKQTRSQKRRSQHLPTIKSTRNSSVGSKSKLSSQVFDKKGPKASSNKTFTENPKVRRQLPLLDKPQTVPKRTSRVINDGKVQGLESKILELQKQINLYQLKYKELEEKSFVGMNKEEAAKVIQRFWRKIKRKRMLKYRKSAEFKSRKESEMIKKNMKIQSEISGKKVKREAESEKEIFKDDIKAKIVQKSPWSINSKEDQFFQKPQRAAIANRYIPIPLDSIRESKIETKEMKAVLLQSHIRRFLARLKYLKMKQSATKISAFYRMHQCRLLYSDIRKAIICIQAFWRHYRVNH